MDNLRCLILAGWINRRQQDALGCLITENRVLGEQLAKNLGKGFALDIPPKNGGI
jgi:hypothetical protein